MLRVSQLPPCCAPTGLAFELARLPHGREPVETEYPVLGAAAVSPVPAQHDTRMLLSSVQRRSAEMICSATTA